MLEMIKNKKNLKWFVIAPVLIIATVLYSCSADKASGEVQISEASAQEQQEMETGEPVSEDEEINENEPEIFVDVGGAVEQPGVVQVEPGCRVFEAIQAAGGEAAGAQTKYMNLAAVCEDGQKIYIPTEEEIKNSADFGGSMPGTGGSADSYVGTQSSSNGKVNINTANSEQLQTLSGIGPSMASRIIEYREANGKFAAVEDLTKVSGIGEKTLSKFIADICV
ncbi:MAG: hypothetical protein HFE90_04035 [Firmicutes bacterium]|nr:hypothetical protein [Bacillota bacterium]